VCTQRDRKWPNSGLQILVRRFDSGPDLQHRIIITTTRLKAGFLVSALCPFYVISSAAVSGAGCLIPPWDWRPGYRLNPSERPKRSDCQIKGDLGCKAERIYHVSGDRCYKPDADRRVERRAVVLFRERRPCRGVATVEAVTTRQHGVEA